MRAEIRKSIRVLVIIVVLYSFLFAIVPLVKNTGFALRISGPQTPAQEPVQSAASMPSGTKTTFVYANGNKVMKINNDDSFHYLHGDHLSSQRVVTDSNGVVEASFDSYPFGGTLKQTGTVDGFKFTGKELDDTGLYYYGTRYYDSKVGRFTTIDLGENRDYIYCDNNPLIYIDPDGARKYNYIIRLDPKYSVIINSINNMFSNLPNAIYSNQPSPADTVQIKFNDVRRDGRAINSGGYYQYYSNIIQLTNSFLPSAANSPQTAQLQNLRLRLTVVHEYSHFLNAPNSADNIYSDAIGLQQGESVMNVANKPQGLFILELMGKVNAYFDFRIDLERKAHESDRKYLDLLHARKEISDEQYKQESDRINQKEIIVINRLNAEREQIISQLKQQEQKDK